jgi:hypothetical protein
MPLGTAKTALSGGPTASPPQSTAASDPQPPTPRITANQGAEWVRNADTSANGATSITCCCQDFCFETDYARGRHEKLLLLHTRAAGLLRERIGLL